MKIKKCSKSIKSHNKRDSLKKAEPSDCVIELEDKSGANSILLRIKARLVQ